MEKEINEKNLKIICGLVDVAQIDSTLVIDLKYAGADNFLKKVFIRFKKVYYSLKSQKNLLKQIMNFINMDLP